VPLFGSVLEPCKEVIWRSVSLHMNRYIEFEVFLSFVEVAALLGKGRKEDEGETHVEVLVPRFK